MYQAAAAGPVQTTLKLSEKNSETKNEKRNRRAMEPYQSSQIAETSMRDPDTDTSTTTTGYCRFFFFFLKQSNNDHIVGLVHKDHIINENVYDVPRSLQS